MHYLSLRERPRFRRFRCPAGAGDALLLECQWNNRFVSLRDLRTMHEPSYAFLKKLLETPSPSGYERPIQEVVRHWAQPYAQEVGTDRHGNVLAVVNPAASRASCWPVTAIKSA